MDPDRYPDHSPVRGRPARRRDKKREEGQCMCWTQMHKLTDGYWWCPNCGRLREQIPSTSKWKFVRPKVLKGVKT